MIFFCEIPVFSPYNSLQEDITSYGERIPHVGEDDPRHGGKRLCRRFWQDFVGFRCDKSANNNRLYNNSKSEFMENKTPKGFSTEFIDSDEGKELYSELESSMSNSNYNAMKRLSDLIEAVARDNTDIIIASNTANTFSQNPLYISYIFNNQTMMKYVL